MTTLYTLFPDVNDLLKMPPEDLGAILLKLALPHVQGAGFIPESVTRISLVDARAGKDYPFHKKQDVERLLSRAWNLLEPGEQQRSFGRASEHCAVPSIDADSEPRNSQRDHDENRRDSHSGEAPAGTARVRTRVRMPFRLVDTGWNRSGQFRRKLLRFLGVHLVRRNARGGGYRSRQGHWAVRHGGHQPAAARCAALGDPAFLFPSLEAVVEWPGRGRRLRRAAVVVHDGSVDGGGDGGAFCASSKCSTRCCGAACAS
jgi:hypothetical protein